MPFQTDPTWSPSTYRRAHSAWSANAPANESKILPRKAEKPVRPKHGALSVELRSLLTWRAMNRGDDWTSVAVNDNHPADRPLIDTTHEIRPTENEIFEALKTVEFVERKHARLGGGGDSQVVPTDGDIERGKVLRQRGKKPDCIVRLGNIHFSNGGREERALVRNAIGKVVPGRVRIPLGGLIKVGRYQANDSFVADNNNAPALTAGQCATASAGRVDFVDPIADAQEAIFVRSAVGSAHAAVLDLAITAANFTEIGKQLGFVGKHAERKGKAVTLEACAVLDAVLAA